jgi:hypothetical protein
MEMFIVIPTFNSFEIQKHLKIYFVLWGKKNYIKKSHALDIHMPYPLYGGIKGMVQNWQKWNLAHSSSYSNEDVKGAYFEVMIKNEFQTM